MGSRLKPTTIEGKKNIIDTKILPYFGKFITNDIEALDIRKWQGELLAYRKPDGTPYSETYLRTIHNQMSAIMNYAVKFYHLNNNPCQLAGAIGKSQADSMKIWTLDEYEHFISYQRKPAGKVIFDILFWSGCREGEALALTLNDFIRVNNESGTEYMLNISKNYAVVKKIEYLLIPKTSRSNRCINIPEFLYSEVMEYAHSLYGYKSDERIFYFRKDFLEKEIKRVSYLAELDPIRVHDLRHSHVSLLIEMGFNILLISERLGHEKVSTTWDTYAHLYPDKKKMLATQLDMVKIKGISQNVSVEEQLLGLLNQLQSNPPTGVPEKIDISSEIIYSWDPVRKEKAIVSQDEIETQFEMSTDMEGQLADLELFQSGYVLLNQLVYFLGSRGLPAEYL